MLYCRSMWRDGLILVLFIGWCVLQTYSADSTCEIDCACDTPPTCWNQLQCCPEMFMRREASDYFDTFMPIFNAKHRRKRDAILIKKRDTVEYYWQNQSCMYPFVYAQSLYKEFQHLDNTNALRVIHDCRRDHNGSDLHRKCLNFRKLHDLVYELFVVDPYTLLVYANRFCAQCSGIQLYEPFQSKFICNDAILGNWELLTLERTPENEMYLIRSGLCVYFLTPPGDDPRHILGANVCISASYTDCDPAVDDLIVNGFSSYDCLSTQISEDANYCAFCGDPSYRHPATDVILQNSSVFRRCDICFLEITLTYSFFILLNLDEALLPAADDRITEPKNLDCGNQSTNIYDNFMVGVILIFHSVNSVIVV